MKKVYSPLSYSKIFDQSCIVCKCKLTDTNQAAFYYPYEELGNRTSLFKVCQVCKLKCWKCNKSLYFLTGGHFDIMQCSSCRAYGFCGTEVDTLELNNMLEAIDNCDYSNRYPKYYSVSIGYPDKDQIRIRTVHRKRCAMGNTIFNALVKRKR